MQYQLSPHTINTFLAFPVACEVLSLLALKFPVSVLFTLPGGDNSPGLTMSVQANEQIHIYLYLLFLWSGGYIWRDKRLLVSKLICFDLRAPLPRLVIPLAFSAFPLSFPCYYLFSLHCLACSSCPLLSALLTSQGKVCYLAVVPPLHIPIQGNVPY